MADSPLQVAPLHPDPKTGALKKGGQQLTARWRRTLCGVHRRYNRLVHHMPDRYGRLLEIVSQYRPTRILEIGTWNGRRAQQLIESAISAGPPGPVEYYGFDLFESSTPQHVFEEVGRVPPSQAEVEAKLQPLAAQGATVRLFAGDTRLTLREAIGTLPLMDFVFIDGGHSYETVRSDWDNVQKMINAHAPVVFDDYVNGAAVRRENWGVNRLVDEIDRSRYTVDLLHPVDWWPKPWGILKNRLALVRSLQPVAPGESGQKTTTELVRYP